jgi:hypothetical protein
MEDENIKPFDYPEIEKLYDVLFDKLFDESGRGALLIVTAYVEDHLTELIKVVLPSDLSKNSLNKLLKYPGHLSSLSAKIELAYSFRLINKGLYDCLTALRKIRNEAAHSSSKFDLVELNEKMHEIYNLGPQIPNVIKEISARMLIKFKIDETHKIFDEFKVPESERQEKLKKIFNDERKREGLKQQLPLWELINGVCFLCGIIVYEKENLSKLTSSMSTWSDLIKHSVSS